MDGPSAATSTRALLAGRYELLSIAGQGGTGTVWRARDLRLDRQVAIKVLHSHLARDASFVAKLLDEARHAAQLSHPNVVAVFDADTDDGTAFIAMEFVSGRSLYEFIAARGPLDTDDTIHLGLTLLDALGHAHRRGLIHRDIKSANVMVGGDLAASKLTDFGTAREQPRKTDGPSSSGLVGTAPYIAPERLRGASATMRSDLYSLACLLYECLVGAPPYGSGGSLADAMRHLDRPVPDVRTVRPDVSSLLARVVMRGLSKDPRDRFADAREMADAIRSCRTGDPASWRAPTNTWVLTRPSSARRDRTVLLASPRPWTRRVPWTECLIACGVAYVTFDILRVWDVQAVLPILPALAIASGFVLGVRRVRRRGKVNRAFMRCDDSVASVVEFSIVVARVIGGWTGLRLGRLGVRAARWSAERVAHLCASLISRWKRRRRHRSEGVVPRRTRRALRAVRGKLRRVRLWRKAKRHARRWRRKYRRDRRRAHRALHPMTRRGWIIRGLIVFAVLAIAVFGAKGWMDDPQVPRTPEQVLRLTGAAARRVAGTVQSAPRNAMRAVLSRGPTEPPATRIALFDPHTVSSAEIDEHHTLEHPARCESSPSVPGAHRCVVWHASDDELHVEDPCFATSVHAVLCMYGDRDVDRWSRYAVASTVTPYRPPASVQRDRHPWRLELADGTFCDGARWIQTGADVAALDPHPPHRGPMRWACHRAWDRRPFAVPKYTVRAPLAEEYFSFTGYMVDDAGHRAALRLDHETSDTWLVLVQEGTGFIASEVRVAWF